MANKILELIVTIIVTIIAMHNEYGWFLYMAVICYMMPAILLSMIFSILRFDTERNKVYTIGNILFVVFTPIINFVAVVLIFIIAIKILKEPNSED